MRKKEKYATAEQTDIKFDVELKWKTPDKTQSCHKKELPMKLELLLAEAPWESRILQALLKALLGNVSIKKLVMKGIMSNISIKMALVL